MIARLFRFLLENQTSGQTVAKNTIWLFAGQFASRALRAVTVIVAARILGAASWGAFSYALGIATFLTTFSDIGINALLTKETAKDPAHKREFLATALFVKFALIAILLAGVFAALPYLTNIPESRALLPILVFVFVFDTLRELGASLSRALEKMQIEAGLQFLANFAIAALGILFLVRFRTSTALAFAYVAGSGIGALTMFVVLRAHFRGFFQNVRGALMGPILKTAWPFGLISLMGTIALNTDIVMLGWMRTPEEVGYYAAAQKLIYLLYVLPGLVAASIFPLTARLAATDPPRAKFIVERAAAGLLLAACALAAFGIMLASPFIRIFFGAAYTEAIPAFRILMLTLIIVYPSLLVSNALFAYGETKKFIRFVTASVVSNVALNFLLIPPLGIEGAALATIGSQLATNALIWKSMRRVNGFTLLPHLKTYLGFGARLH